MRILAAALLSFVCLAGSCQRAVTASDRDFSGSFQLASIDGAALPVLVRHLLTACRHLPGQEHPPPCEPGRPTGCSKVVDSGSLMLARNGSFRMTQRNVNSCTGATLEEWSIEGFYEAGDGDRFVLTGAPEAPKPVIMRGWLLDDSLAVAYDSMTYVFSPSGEAQ